MAFLLYTDGGGLTLQVSRTGTKSWIFRYTHRGKRHQMGLGSCHVVGLVRARELAQVCRLLLQEWGAIRWQHGAARRSHVPQRTPAT